MQMQKADQLRAEIASIGEMLRNGRPDRALKRATKAAKKWPNVSALPRLAGLSAIQTGNFQQAQAFLERAWRLDPGNPELIQNYGLSLVQGGAPDKALKFLDRISAQVPLTPPQLFIRAMALLQEGMAPEALETIEQVLRREPANLNAQILRADILDGLQQWDRAIEALTDVVRRNPKFLHGQIRLAKAQVGLGQFDEALTHTRAALQLAPGYPELLELMASLPNLTENDIAVLRTQVEQVQDSGTVKNPQDAAKLEFAAASLARLGKNTPQEMWHLAKAHGLLRQGFQSWEVQSQKDCANRLAAPLSARDDPREGNPRPIFVVGLPRSGTTLVERILARHSDVQGLGELAAVHQWARKAEAQEPEWRDTHKLADFYLEKLPAVPDGTVAFVDKAPGNYAFLGEIAQAFPDAVILNVLRDPRDIALSMWRASFGAGGLYYTHDFKWMAAEANRYQRYMQHWHEVLPGRIHDIRYETLVSNLQDTAQELARLCDLSFEDAMLSPEKSPNAIRTASNLQARKSVSTSSVGGWQAVAGQLEPFVKELDAELWPDLS